MNKFILATSCTFLALSATSQAAKYPQNPVIRPLTLTESTIELSGGYLYGKQHDKDNESTLAANMAYGISDDLQVSLTGLTYSLFKNKNSGFELAATAGINGYYDDKNGDNLGLGLNLFAKQIINKNFAFTFGTSYTHWKIEDYDNRSEFDYSIGALMNLAPKWTLAAQYTYRDLKDFEQSHANSSSLTLNYTLSKNTDIGTSFMYSDFSENLNDSALLETPEKALALYISYRF
jgi:opacity protein-like surface antigen